MKQRRLVWILLAAAALLLLVAAGAIVLYFGLRAKPSELSSWRDPRAEIVVEKIVPLLALYPLAGASEVETIDVALSQGELETAQSVLVYGLDLTDAQRIGRLLILGTRLNDEEKADRASQVFQQVYDLAVLSPRLTDSARADALLATAKGWNEGGFRADAVASYDQAFMVATYSPYLQMAQRRELLGRLKDAYENLGERERVGGCEQQIEELDRAALSPALVTEQPGLTLGGKPISLENIGELEEARRQATLALVEDLVGGMELSQERLQALAVALRAEDQAKLIQYEQLLAETSQPERRVDVLWALIRWLTVKVQVAAGGFGASLVPEWEGEITEIRSALSTRYEDLYFAYEDLVTALPEASHLDQGSYMVRRAMNLAGRLGQYPNFPAQQMADKLTDAALKLMAAGNQERLFVDVLADEGQLRFFLNAAESYGQSPQSP